MQFRTTLVSVGWASALLACGGSIAATGTGDTGPGELDAGNLPTDAMTVSVDSSHPVDAGPADAVAAADSASTTLPSPPLSPDGGLLLPAECANPGPFVDQPTAMSLAPQLVGTWLNCGNSWFTGAGVPIDEVGVEIRADMTWQKLGFSGGMLVGLAQHYDHGTWSMYPGGCCGEMLLLSWDTEGLATLATFSADGRSMSVNTSAGGNEATLAKETGTP